MTRNLSHRRAIVADRKFPDVCPKCGQALGQRRTLPAVVRTHFERSHPKAIGTAYQDGSSALSTPALFDFGYVAPVAGVTRRRWYVVAFAWPFGLVTISPDDWTIVWKAGAVPGEGVQG